MRYVTKMRRRDLVEHPLIGFGFDARRLCLEGSDRRIHRPASARASDLDEIGVQELAHSLRVASDRTVEECKFRSLDGIEPVARLPHGYRSIRASVISGA